MLKFDILPDNLSKVILAEDNSDYILFFKLALSNLPIPVQLTIAEDYKQLLSLLSDSIPDFIFLALGMRSMNGLAAMEGISKMPNFENIPVILITPHQDKNLITSSGSKGLGSSLSKNSNLIDLVEKLKSIFKCGLGANT